MTIEDLRQALAPAAPVLAPLSVGQRQMWVVHQIDPAATAYLMSWTARITGRLDAEALRAAWEQVVSRYEILRTRYAVVDETPMQVIDPPGRFELDLTDLSEVTSGEREETAVLLAGQERRRPFDLAVDHPLRARLLRLSTETHLFVVTMHHIAGDAESYQRITTEVGAFYREQVAGVPAALPDVTMQYADYAAWERDRIAGGSLARHLRYWQQNLANLSDIELPTDRPRQSRPDWRGGAVDIGVGTELADRIRRLALRSRATPYLVLLSAYHVMVAQLSGSADVAVGTPVTLRTRPELDGLVGYGINTVVVRARCSDDLAFSDVLAQVRDEALAALDHREAPFGLVVAQVRPQREAAANPLFQVAFDWDAAAVGALDLAGVRTEPIPPDDTWEVAKFDLTMHAGQTPDGHLAVSLEFARALFDERTAQDWAEHYRRLLTLVVADPGTPMSRLPTPPRPRRQPAGVARDDAVGPGDVDIAVAVPEILRQAWREVLDIDEVDPADNFFEVGGDSLRAVSLAGRLRVAGLDVSAADIFAHQSVAELAKILATRVGRAAPVIGTAPFALIDDTVRASLPPGLADAYPVGTAQLGMIIEMLSRPDGSRYQDTTSFLVRDDHNGLDSAALRAAAQLVVDRHETLRTTFDLHSFTMPLQLVHRTATIDVGVTDHGPLGPQGWQSGLLAYAAEQRAIRMDLSRAPLLRVHAHTAAGTSQWWLSITECHAVLEGWSFHSLLMEIVSLYREIREGRTPAPPDPVPFRYADHIAAELRALQSQEDRDYWREVIGGRVPVTLPSAWRGSRDEPEERYQHTVAFHDLEDALRRLATQTQTSLKAVLLAAHLTVMSAVSESQAFHTGLVCDARPEMVGAERVPGMYLNTLPFALPIGAGTWAELIRKVYDELTVMWPHRRLPMQVIQQELAQGTRLIEVMFNYLDFHQVDKDAIGWEATVTETDNEFALHVFTLSGLIRLNSTTHVLSRPAGERLGAMYRTVLEAMAAGAHGDAYSVMLPDDHLAWLRQHGTGTELAGPATAVLDAFAAQVRARPDAVATQDAERTLTYAELDAHATELAARLKAVGVAAGDLTALAPDAEPTLLLGVWRAGAAAMPLPTASPAERSGAAVLLTGTAAEPRIETVERDTLPAGSPDVACVLPATGPITHAALAAALRSAAAGLTSIGAATSPESSWRRTAALSSIDGLIELLLPLTSGGRTVTGPASHMQGPAAVTEAWDEPGANVIVVTDPVLGSPTPGPARAGRTVTATVAGAVPGWLTLDGRPVPGVRLRVLDARQHPAPVGARGELCVSGAAVPGGNLVPDPLDGQSPGLLRTGQLARFRADGTLEVLGPRELHTAPEGAPVDLTQVREALLDQPGVRQVGVVFRPNPGGGSRVVGYVGLEPEAPFDPAATRRALGQRLPRQLVPDVLVPVSRWPLTADGRVDPDALPEPVERAAATSRSRPWDARFETILRAALPFLAEDDELTEDLELVGAGLDSLTTVELLVSLEHEYDIVIPDRLLVLQLFETPTTLWREISALFTRQDDGEPQ
ncbi:condensation domain-containing protein [Actinoplanes sp. NPDC051346]|uniref:condensation domain-containing protein n=1 Tax=Actinoplanes sp. NPDC051346 TaxID=3155048 RepID=UPI00342AED99